MTTTERLLELLGMFVGALVMSFLLTRACQWGLGRLRVDRKKSIVLSAALFIALVIASVASNHDVRIAYVSVPALALWFLVDWFKVGKSG